MPESSEDVAPTPASSWWKLSGIFFEPTQTFRKIDQRPNWLLPVLVTIAAVATNLVVLLRTIGLEGILRAQMTSRLQGRNLSEEQLDALVNAVVNGSATQIFLFLQPVLSEVLVLLCALLFIAALYLMGAETRFAKVFSVSAHTFFFYFLLYSTLSSIVILFAQDRESIDFENPLYSNLGFTVSRMDSPALYSFASSLDVISFYHIYLLALGLSTVSRNISFSITLSVVIVLWALLVAAKVAMAGLFG